jgi:predicted RecA/RadA family phage recombinase
MQAIYVQCEDAIDYTPAARLPSGSVVLIGALVGITSRPLAAGELGTLALTGIFDIARAPGAAVPAGTRHFWDATAGQAVTVDGGGANRPLGVSVTDAGADDRRVRIRLNHPNL